MVLLYILLLAVSCEPEIVECLCPEDFIDKWWQVELSSGPVGNCYLFAESGHLVESDGENTWPIGQWELEYLGECRYSIIAGEDKIDILGISESCLELEFDGKNYEACECSL